MHRWDLKFLVGVLNSKLVEFWLKNKGKMQGENYQLDKEPLCNIPLPEQGCNQQSISSKVKDIIIEKEECSSSNSEIDRLVYELYGLTNGEVKIIDPNETTIGSDDDLFKA
ncbi:MAG: hypothetical protein HUJ98_10675 [Bacteroidaceae bacterium]|nr:hypothetical protein [Bacteroidaceae bacterium]